MASVVGQLAQTVAALQAELTQVTVAHKKSELDIESSAARVDSLSTTLKERLGMAHSCVVRVAVKVSAVIFAIVTELKRHAHVDSETMSVAMKQLTESLSSKEDLWQQVLEEEAKQRELVEACVWLFVLHTIIG